MKNGIGAEAKIRDYLAEHMDQLPDLVTNLAEYQMALDKSQDDFIKISAEQGGPTPLDLLKKIILRRNSNGLESFYDLEVIGTEFTLLSTGKAGYQPSADILAQCSETSRLFLFEIKQLVETERQAVTELSAYSHGLHTRIGNMTPADYAWIPVCTDWRTTVRAAFANEVIFSGRSILPLKCTVDWSHHIPVQLEILDLVEDIDEPTALAQFSWCCFDTMTLSLAKEPSDPRTLMDFISSTSARHGFSGCVLYGESPVGSFFPYPYTFAINVHNPYLGSLKRRQLEIVRQNGDRQSILEMRQDTKHPIWMGFDIDFNTMADRWDSEDHIYQLKCNGEEEEANRLKAENEVPYLSMKRMAFASDNRTQALFDEIKQRLDLFCDFEIGAPSFKGFLEQPLVPLIEYVAYFGLMQEAVVERLLWEVSNSSAGDGPIIGDFGGDATYAMGSPDFFFSFMGLMNFEHESQTEYYE